MAITLGNGTVTFGDNTVQATAENYPTKLMDTTHQNNPYRHSFVIMSDGGVKAWGYNATGILGTGDTTVVPGVGDVGFPPSFPGAASIYTNRTLNSFCIDVNGQLWSWGRNDYGSAGNGTAVAIYTPYNASNNASNSIYGKTVTYVAVPNGQEEIDFVMVLCSDGTVHACGYNGYGQCGDGTTTNRYNFVRCGALAGVTSISCGRERYTSCMAISSGVMYNWGYNGDYELGTGNTTSSSSPASRMTGSLSGKTATYVTNGYLCQFVLCSDNTLHGVGNQQQGQLGIGNTTVYSTFQQMRTGVQSVVAGGYDYPLTVIITTSNTVYFAGNDSYIIPYTVNTPYYTYDIYGHVTGGPFNSWSKVITNGWYQVTGWSGTVSKVGWMGTGGYNSLFVMNTAGTIYSYGRNGYGQLGAGRPDQPNVFMPYGSLTTGNTDPNTGTIIGPLTVCCDAAADFSTVGEADLTGICILTNKKKVKYSGYGGDYASGATQAYTKWVPTTVNLNG